MPATQIPEVLKVEEVAELLRVPEKSVRAEIDAGRLPLISIGGEERILRDDVLALRQLKRPRLILRPAPKFSFKWPSGTTEEYGEAHAGVVRVDDETKAIRIGFTERETAGKLRRRAVVFVNQRPRVEFVASDDFEKNGLMVAIIKTKTGRQIPPSEFVPREYEKFRVEPYNLHITGPNSYSNLAVLCASSDLETMVDLALIRAANDAKS